MELVQRSLLIYLSMATIGRKQLPIENAHWHSQAVDWSRAKRAGSQLPSFLARHLDDPTLVIPFQSELRNQNVNEDK